MFPCRLDGILDILFKTTVLPQQATTDGGLLNGGTPSHHPFRTMGFSMKKSPSSYWDTPYGTQMDFCPPNIHHQSSMESSSFTPPIFFHMCSTRQQHPPHGTCRAVCRAVCRARNIVKITLPTEMDAISTEVMHTIQARKWAFLMRKDCSNIKTSLYMIGKW